MAADLFKADNHFKQLIQFASELTRQNLETLCLRGPARTLMQAKYLQPLIVAVSMGYLRHCVDRGLSGDIVLGHSLGEISALACAGVLTPHQAVEIAAKRGELMDMAAAAVQGGMLAVVFMPLGSVQELLHEMNLSSRIVIANDNAKDQIVLSGLGSALDEFAATVAVRQLGKTKRLEVAGPWHSPYMETARTQFAQWVQSQPFKTPLVPIVFNASGTAEADPVRIKAIITNQLTSPVYFRACMETLHREGITRLVEIGPGRILCGLARVNGYTDRKSIYAVNNLRGLDIVVSETGA